MSTSFLLILRMCNHVPWGTVDGIIKELFAKIRKDKRHKDILMILDQKIENRIFENYEANFSIMKTKKDIEKLNTYLSHYDFENKYPKNIKTLIEPFLL